MVSESSPALPGVDPHRDVHVLGAGDLCRRRIPGRVLHGSARREAAGLVLALILAPWWINYITRMLAWVNLLQDDGYVNKALGIFGVAPVSWLAGNPFTVVIALAYGYLPFFIIPLFASLDRIDQRLLEASRDLGVGSVRTFLHVTLPLSKLGLITAIVITALPLAGDYYTNAIVSGSPNTTMIGNQIELFLLQGPLKNFGASWCCCSRSSCCSSWPTTSS